MRTQAERDAIRKAHRCHDCFHGGDCDAKLALDDADELARAERVLAVIAADCLTVNRRPDGYPAGVEVIECAESSFAPEEFAPGDFDYLKSFT